MIPRAAKIMTVYIKLVIDVGASDRVGLRDG